MTEARVFRRKVAHMYPLQLPLEKIKKRTVQKEPEKELTEQKQKKIQKRILKTQWCPGLLNPLTPLCFLLFASCMLGCHASRVDERVCFMDDLHCGLYLQLSTGPSSGPLGRALPIGAMAGSDEAMPPWRADAAQLYFKEQPLQEMCGWEAFVKQLLSVMQPFLGTVALSILWLWHHNGHFIFWVSARKRRLKPKKLLQVVPKAKCTRFRFGPCRWIGGRRHRCCFKKYRLKGRLFHMRMLNIKLRQHYCEQHSKIEEVNSRTRREHIFHKAIIVSSFLWERLGPVFSAVVEGKSQSQFGHFDLPIFGQPVKLEPVDGGSHWRGQKPRTWGRKSNHHAEKTGNSNGRT